MDRQQVIDWFKDYTDRYDSNDPKIELKINHTYRVANLSERIIMSIGSSAEDADIAWTIGMLHDVGRFEQVKRFGTFVDADSVDHAQFGADLLFCEGLFEEFATSDVVKMRKLIETAIRNHSNYRIDERLSKREKMFCNILRDADKIDILRVNIETPPEDIYNVSTDDLKRYEVCEAVMKAFDEEHAVLRSMRKTAVDILVGHISLIYELVYPISLSIVREQGYLERMMNFESDNPITCKQFEHIREHMNEYLERNCLTEGML